MPRVQIALTQPDISDLEYSYVKEALTNGRLAAGESFSFRCSSELTARLGCTDVLLTTSCTDALELSALLLEIGPGDVVVIPSFTFSSVATAFIGTGAAVRFVDIEKSTLGIDPASLALAMDEDVKAVVPVHYAGVPFDLYGVIDVLDNWPKAALIEDNAHGLFGRLDDRPLGTFGPLGVTSFHTTKNLVSGEGGALIVNDPSLADRAQVLAEKGTDRNAFLRGQVDKYTWRDTGSSFGLSELNAALLAGQLERSDDINNVRSQRYQKYLDLLQGSANEGRFSLPNDRARAIPIRHLFHVLLDSESLRDSVLADLKAAGIGAAFHYVPLHSAPAAAKYERGSQTCPVAEDVSRRLLRLPLHSRLTTSDVEYVADRFLASLARAMFERALVTGGAGFIGGHLVNRLLMQQVEVICVDKLTYAGNQGRLSEQIDRGIEFHQVDIADADALDEVIRIARPEVVFHLAAESHVDRSIDGPEAFITTNIIGTANLLKACLRLQNEIEVASATDFRLISVSTDEVFGSAKADEYFQPSSRYQPRSPYAASKAAADHLVSAWHHTFGLNAIVTNCSNNYGPFQFPEKLIPHLIIRALSGLDLPVYGDGGHQRDWIHVSDHVGGLVAAAWRGRPGDTYVFGGRAVMSNLEVVRAICRELDSVAPAPDSYSDRITFVPDRPGHDRRYAIDPSTSEVALGWEAEVDLGTGLRQTVEWYVANESWWRGILDAGYTAGRIGRGQ